MATKNSLVLLVDDVPQNIQVLGNILKNQGYSFALTTNGKETFELLAKKTPDIILLDIMLPDEDGFSICEKLKANPDLKHIPIIFLSAKHDIKDKIRGFELGAVDYITKPFEDIEVIGRVTNHLQAKLDRDKIEQYNHELEDMVEQRTQELIIKERESILAQFMQGVIHNVRGPITSVANGMDVIDMMKDGIEQEISQSDLQDSINDELQEIWELNKLNKEKLEALLKDLKSMLKKSRTDHNEEIEITDLNRIIEQEIDFLNVDLEFKNQVKKEINLSIEPLPIKVITAEISQLFQNLVKNAMDALYQYENKEIDIETGIIDQMAYFKVSDNGPGIPPELLARIFDPFFTTKPKECKDDSKAPTGTGIGLRFCKSTAESYGGSISVEVSKKGGACFMVKLPLNK
ncbi:MULTISPECIES: hybrid sensor histidine kinase/response regulator [unclassified Lentimicrobium]|uniref:hybrid sensor histidine kinase/response regulator n=1 Tax=unclassified Lentimicrobium TaxID=2677434 RepID=UPI001552BB14|nr:MULTISPECIES: hybrid sensor histidine kinase/response regulator [unclassified Lentimicrobium]NPD46537.1 hybrid sensor histidine kinase/response regulator [Lentimicrobium sp. S6]NPD85186.1 hybrid sensor histidine kinase/response regulator [Lentimicrobium sp. L6]